MLFDESFHGYYIHGKSPFGQAEISHGRLKKALNYEISGKGQIRGLSETDPDLQTFEIYMPKEVMLKYRTEYLVKVDQAIGVAH